MYFGDGCNSTVRPRKLLSLLVILICKSYNNNEIGLVFMALQCCPDPARPPIAALTSFKESFLQVPI